MSRIGKQPVVIPAGVKVSVANGLIKVEGPKGKLEFAHHPNVKVDSDGKQLTVTRPDDNRVNRALHGLTRALINNMVVGVTKGYEKKLKIEGVGYQAAMKGKAVELTVGFANRIVHEPPAGVTVALKNGGLSLNAGNSDWQVNSVGWVSGDGRSYLMSVLSTGNPSEEYGIATLNHLGAMVWRALAPHR